MSGGSHDYAYGHVQDFIRQVEQDSEGIHPDLVAPFIAHMKLVADAMHAIEWAASGDSPIDDSTKAINAMLEDEK